MVAPKVAEKRAVVITHVMWPDAGLMLVQRHRQWPNIKQVFGQRAVTQCWFNVGPAS